MDATKEKFPLRTINGHKCLTKCFEKKKSYLHPVTLRKLTLLDINSCAIEPIIKKNSVTDYEECKPDQNATHSIPSEKDSILLDFKFSAAAFLSDIYDIHSFNETITWTLEHNHSHFNTIKRIHNASWKAFGSVLDNVSEFVINFYYDIAKHNWMIDFMDMINKKYSFDTARDTNIMDLIISNFFSEDFFTQIIKKYIHIYKSEWLQIDSHYGNLKKFTYKCLIQNIQYKSTNNVITSNTIPDIDLFSS